MLIFILILIVILVCVYLISREKSIILGSGDDILNIYLIRHGETESNKSEGFNISDEHINETGIEQASIASKYLAYRNVKFDEIYCSPLTRCRETLEILKKNIKYGDIKYDDRLVEIGAGKFAGLSKDDPINNEFISLFNKLMDKDPISYYDNIMKNDKIYAEKFGIEPLPKVSKRLDEFLDSLPKNGNILIVSHNGIINYLISHLFHLGGINKVESNLEGGKNCHISLIRKSNNQWNMICPPSTEYVKYYK